jgi:hypothetical protein
MTNCTNCGQTIKNIVTISGKPYGTTCAEYKLGISLPIGFSGDYDAHIENVAIMQAKCRNQKKRDSIYWADMDLIYSRLKVVLSRKYDLTEWELSFCRSLISSIESMNGSLTNAQLDRFEAIEAPISKRITAAKNIETAKLIDNKFQELIPMAKMNGWNATQLTEYIKTII